ncbi:MAG: hypothetical protein F6K37_23860 [Moorea sp. SIO4E2]|uniref:hypothetical protein n=1 Tax=Moorena sp. SIO4E2 TaxID=2607826 RepID=UPI0013BB6C7C|nr:hypothetical protein [Moorena sp. SIO4E2]NEQ08867.1 hypothetical protein [Moorena sp. SIO4E2]
MPVSIPRRAVPTRRKELEHQDSPAPNTPYAFPIPDSRFPIPDSLLPIPFLYIYSPRIYQ